MNNSTLGGWHIAYMSAKAADEPGTRIATINAVEPLCDDAYSQYVADKQAVAEYSRSETLIHSVQLNIQEFLQSVVNYAADFLETRAMEEELIDEIALNFSRQLLNVLSMFRSLLDHSSLSLSRTFGKESTQLARWQATLARIYDASFEYRFFYKLRNYSQHVGMPPMSFNFTDSADEDGIGFRLDFSRDRLLEEKESWNVQLRQDLLSKPEKIPVIDALHNWSVQFQEIARELLAIKREAAIDAAQRICGHRNRLSIPEDGNICVVRIPTFEPNPKRLNLHLDWVPERKARTVIAGYANTAPNTA